MRVCGLILLSCLTFVFIPWHAKAQTALSSNETITSSENLTSDKIPSSNGTVPAQDRQLLEQQFFNTGNDLFRQRNYTDAITYYDKALELNSTDTKALNKLNLTYSNANNTITSGVQKTDQTLLIAVGVFVSLAIDIFLINLVAGRKRAALETRVITRGESTEMDQSYDKKYNLEEIDDEWKGI